MISPDLYALLSNFSLICEANCEVNSLNYWNNLKILGEKYAKQN